MKRGFVVAAMLIAGCGSGSSMSDEQWRTVYQGSTPFLVVAKPAASRTVTLEYVVPHATYGAVRDRIERIDVRETKDEVRIDVVQRVDFRGDIEGATVRARVEVPLKEPLGQRSVTHAPTNAPRLLTPVGTSGRGFEPIPVDGIGDGVSDPKLWGS